MCNKFWCSVFDKGTQPFDFIKRNEIHKTADEVRLIGQISILQQWNPGIKIKQANQVKSKKLAN